MANIATETHVVYGIHIAHEYATLAALDLRGRVLRRQCVPHATNDPNRTLTGIASAFARFRHGRPDRRKPLGLGVAVGGWVDSEQGVVVEHGSLGWYDVHVGAVLAELTGIPVRVDGHARALPPQNDSTAPDNVPAHWCTCSSATSSTRRS